ncbi:winged helix-turn-helix domain-containing protein [Silvibacterium sp.]|uniref:winged helix-turn-helix domain-containing protein n=1 Tax=Silvibacterium sp. TaxID=1964179 RepID=UPI0039E5D5A8
MLTSMPNPEARPPARGRPGAIYEFHEFRLDCGGFELRRSGHPLRIERKPMELLILLVSHESRLVTRSEIARQLWASEVFVDTEHGINTAIRKLRYLLRDDPDHPRFIQTVTGKGYRFIAPVTLVAPLVPAKVDTGLTPVNPPAASRRSIGWYWYAAAGLCMALLVFGITLYRSHRGAPQIRYTQLTDFTDSAVGPALSPDGHMLAFIRGSAAFLSTDQIYVKMLPDGEARLITNDARMKYGLAFSPDGSQITYTVLEGATFSTYSVSVLGGEPHLLLENAAGLTWLDAEHLLYSRVEPGSGIHMGIVTAARSGAGLHAIYYPGHIRGMAHNAFPSPDRHWAIVVEMDGSGAWAQCRLIALDGPGASRTIGPAGACTAAGWSPDGRWMYFTATSQEQSHIWRQHFPQGEPEQITFGPTEEDGLVVAANTDASREHSLITSVGVHQSALWIHDEKGERPLSSEGQVINDLSPPVFTTDGRTLYYLLRREEQTGAELWRTAVDSGQSEAVFPGVSMIAFDLSTDGNRVVYSTVTSGGTTQLWTALIDRSVPATQLGIAGARNPHFGENSQILFEETEGHANYLEQIDFNGSHRSRALTQPILNFLGTSPDKRWVLVSVPALPAENRPAVVGLPLHGGNSVLICEGYCVPQWSTDGKTFFITVEFPSRNSIGRTLAIPVAPGHELPDLPAEGISGLTKWNTLAGARSIGRSELVPGKDPEHYAWVETSVHRNLYRISLP